MKMVCVDNNNALGWKLTLGKIYDVVSVDASRHPSLAATDPLGVSEPWVLVKNDAGEIVEYLARRFVAIIDEEKEEATIIISPSPRLDLLQITRDAKLKAEEAALEFRVWSVAPKAGAPGAHLEAVFRTKENALAFAEMISSDVSNEIFVVSISLTPDKEAIFAKFVNDGECFAKQQKHNKKKE